MKVAELCQVCSWYSYCSLYNRFPARTHLFIPWRMLMLTPQTPSLYSYKAALAYNPELNYVVVRFVW